MSKIHEAIKRAQQEHGVGALPGGSKTAAEMIAAESAKLEELSPKAAEDGTGKAALGVPSSGPATLEALLLHCAQPQWTPDPLTMPFLSGKNHSQATEEFRTLRSRLYQIRETQPIKKLLITSTVPGEGKSFVAANLAAAVACQHERPALLIDGDLRRSQLCVPLGAPAKPGLSDYLLGEAGEFAVIQRGPQENLFFIPGGKQVSNPAELLTNGRMADLIRRVAPAFDWIILDSPPVVTVSDASLIAGFCDGVLLVIGAGTTPYDVAQKASQEFREKRLVGVVLNRVDLRTIYSSYYYHEYYSGQAARHKNHSSKAR